MQPEETRVSLQNLLDPQKRTKYFVRALMVFSVCAVVIFGLLVKSEPNKTEAKTSKLTPSPFENLTLEAKAVLVWDVVHSHELFAKNPDLALPLASLTKVMTAITANQILGDRDVITIIEEHLKPDGDSGLLVGDVWRKNDLIDFVLLTSSNDGAYALADAAATKSDSAHPSFVDKMNEMANQIGLENSHFWNEHGLDRELEKSGAYGSARDLTLMFEYALKQFPELLEATRYSSLNLQSSANVYSALNTNSNVDLVPGLLASKTGFTDLAGGNLVIAFDAGLQRPIIIAVLGSSEQGRFDDVLKLVEAAQKEIKSGI